METAENGDSSTQASVQGITVHDFSEKILEQLVHFHVMKLSGGFFLWVGSGPVLSNLAVSIGSKYVSPALSKTLSCVCVCHVCTYVVYIYIYTHH